MLELTPSLKHSSPLVIPQLWSPVLFLALLLWDTSQYFSLHLSRILTFCFYLFGQHISCYWLHCLWHSWAELGPQGCAICCLLIEVSSSCHCAAVERKLADNSFLLQSKWLNIYCFPALFSLGRLLPIQPSALRPLGTFSFHCFQLGILRVGSSVQWGSWSWCLASKMLLEVVLWQDRPIFRHQFSERLMFILGSVIARQDTLDCDLWKLLKLCLSPGWGLRGELYN